MWRDLLNTGAVIASGTAKATALQRWRAGEPLPIARVADPVDATVVTERACLLAEPGAATDPGAAK